jgi:tetratricopeptide (TPR) repeat protein
MIFGRRNVRITCLVFALLVSLWGGRTGVAQDASNSVGFSEVRALYFAGEYGACIEKSQGAVERGIWNDIWSRLLIQALLETGQYERACEVYESVAQKFANSLPLRMLAAEAYRYSGKHEQGQRLLKQIPAVVQAAPWRFSDRDNMLAIGKLLLDEGEDARAVLDGFYDRSLKLDPGFVEGHLAVAELALNKGDFQEAVRALGRAVELRPEDPQVFYLLSQAWAPSDSQKATENLQRALTLNPRHVNSLLAGARALIDQEAYDDAQETLQQVLKVNQHEPRAWALKGAIAHLKGEYADEGVHRAKALASWQMNPEVDFLIGKILSRHYRFAESVVYQRRALRLDPSYLPARFQLAQDLLRLGATDEGWSIVDHVAELDAYNVVAYNLKTLQSRLAEFETLEAPGLIVRMQSREAELYGQRVLDLLEEARDHLSEKYEVQLDSPIVVEIFPQQSDFAIRTFGLPGGAGFLGVCFGNLITANSPASQGNSPSNWESVLWHEFCHVITLNKTKNRMPRWLSEGISVYEELERDSSWGQRMNPTYKKMILGEEFVPLSQLSGAFLKPKTPLHLQFAYFQSSLAVRYLIDEHGLPLLLRLLDSLGLGLPIDQAFERLYGDMSKLDEDFHRFATSAAMAFCPDTQFERGDFPARADEAGVDEVLASQPGHYLAWQAKARALIARESWEEAFEAAEKLRQLYPDDAGETGGLATKANIARLTNDEDLERQTLSELTNYSNDNVLALLRLIELHRNSEDWEGLAIAAEKLLAVQPLIGAGHEAQALAAFRRGTPERAIAGLRAQLALDPLDTAKLQYDLALALYESEQLSAARLAVLQALEEAPRFRAAQRLLLTIHRWQSPGSEQVPTSTDEQTDATIGNPPLVPEEPNRELNDR